MGGVLPYKWEACCSTNGRCIVGFPFPQGLEARKVQRYKWGAYCRTNWRCAAVLSPRPGGVGVSETLLISGSALILGPDSSVERDSWSICHLLVSCHVTSSCDQPGCLPQARCPHWHYLAKQNDTESETLTSVVATRVRGPPVALHVSHYRFPQNLGVFQV